MALTTVQGELLESGSALENIGAGGITPSYLDTQAQYTGFKNRIINGAMMIDQRNAGASVTPANGVVTFITDRWGVSVNQSSKLTAQQSTTAPAGFINSLLITSSSAYSLVSTDVFVLTQKIEGLNVSDLAWGTASASPVTVSFKVRSSLTGTFGGVIRNSASNRFYPFTYTINSADTFEDKTLTLAGDTTGTWLTNNGTGLELIFSVGVGSSYLQPAGAWTSSFALSAVGTASLVGTDGATFYITGVQLEKGSVATSFDYRPYGTEFDLCRRYAEVYSGGTNEEGSIPQYFAQVDSANRPEIMITYYPKRTGPTFTLSGNFAWNSAANTGIAATYAGAYVGTFTRGTNLFFSVASGVSTNSLSGVGMILFGASGGGKIIINAEL